MSEDTVKLMRLPKSTNCADCSEALAFGVWAYYNPNSGDAICPECAVKRGWSPKHRIKQLIKGLELQEDIKALREHKKHLVAELMDLKRKVDIHKLAEKDTEIEKAISQLESKVQDYLRHCATEGEDQLFTDVFHEMRACQDLRKKLQEEIESQSYLITRRELRQKKREQRVTA